jgi:hypothetical protein
MAPNFLSFLSNKLQLLSAIASSSGSGDADKIVATDSGGKIDRSFLDRIVTLSSSANLTAINSDTTDIGIITLSENTTFQNPTGTPTNGRLLQIRITSASSQAIAFGTDYQAASGLALPTATTGGGAEDYIAFRWNATDDKWDMIGTTIGAYPTASGLSFAQTVAIAMLKL